MFHNVLALRVTPVKEDAKRNEPWRPWYQPDTSRSNARLGLGLGLGLAIGLGLGLGLGAALTLMLHKRQVKNLTTGGH